MRFPSSSWGMFGRGLPKLELVVHNDTCSQCQRFRSFTSTCEIKNRKVNPKDLSCDRFSRRKKNGFR